MTAIFWTLRILFWIFSWTVVLFCWAIAGWINHTFNLGLTSNWDMLKLTASVPFYAPLLWSMAGAVEMLMPPSSPELALRLVAFGAVLPVIVNIILWA